MPIITSYDSSSSAKEINRRMKNRDLKGILQQATTELRRQDPAMYM